MPKYRKKAVTVEAVQFDQRKWPFNLAVIQKTISERPEHGEKTISERPEHGDWIVWHPDGSIEICKPDTFAAMYCRFENTLADLRDCFEHLHDGDLSESEEAAREELIEYCRQIVDETED